MFWEQAMPFRVLVGAAACLAWLELRKMASLRGAKYSAVLGLAFVASYLLLSTGLAVDGGMLDDQWAGAREALLAAYIMAVALRLVVMEDQQNGVSRLVVEVAGTLYIALFASFILRLHVLPQGPGWVVMVFAFAWIYDSGAYFTGKSIGKTPFSAWSPAKTWEGFIGGLVAAGVAAPLLMRWLLGLEQVPAWQLVLLGVVAGALAQLGDLVESMFKRWAGVKDSGGVLGAHGGFLDKMDSSMFVAPLVYGAAIWWGLEGLVH